MDNDSDVVILIVLGFIAAICGGIGTLIHSRMQRAVQEEQRWRDGDYDTDRGTYGREAPDEVEGPDEDP